MSLQPFREKVQLKLFRVMISNLSRQQPSVALFLAKYNMQHRCV